MKAHEKGLLHRSFSIFIYNSKGEVLLQKRASTKYHSPGLWSNTCCSHQRPYEATMDAAHRRLVEEMGFDCSMEEIFTFVYKQKFNNGLTEHEFDHVLLGKYSGAPVPDISEVESWKWMPPVVILRDAVINSEIYTTWLIMALKRFET